MSVARWVMEGSTDGWDMPLRPGWYFDGEDKNMYGPYASKELCENAFIRYCADLDRIDLQDIPNDPEEDR
jgi:hypothetical protein